MYRTREIPKRSGVAQRRRRTVYGRKWGISQLWPWVFYRTHWPELAGLMLRQLREQGYHTAYFDRYAQEAPSRLCFIVVGVRVGWKWLLRSIQWVMSPRHFFQWLSCRFRWARRRRQQVWAFVSSFRLLSFFVLANVLFFGSFWLFDILLTYLLTSPPP